MEEVGGVSFGTHGQESVSAKVLVHDSRHAGETEKDKELLAETTQARRCKGCSTGCCDRSAAPSDQGIHPPARSGRRW